MTDYTRDTPKLGREWCPGCAPEGDPTREILDVSWCGEHPPVRTGLDDARVGFDDCMIVGNGESEGLVNSAFQKLIRSRGGPA